MPPLDPAHWFRPLRRPKGRACPLEPSLCPRGQPSADWTAGHTTPQHYISIMDTRTPEQRRRIMKSVRTKNTGPELAIRKALFAAGYRYRLHRKDLSGSPDIVFPSRKKAIFVHGCFWHGHDCDKGRPSKSRTEYWGPKIETNRLRDERNLAALAERGWKTLVVWQCELREFPSLFQRIIRFVEGLPNSIDKA